VHRIGKAPKPSENGTIASPRPVILKFATYRLRDRMYRKRTQLKKYEEAKVYINEDLTAARSSLLWKARQLKKSKVISECWTHDGQVLIKTSRGTIKPIYTTDDLPTASATQESADGNDTDSDITDDESTPQVIADSTDSLTLASAPPEEVWEKAPSQE